MEATFPGLAADMAADGQSVLVVPATIGGKDEDLPSTFDVISPYVGKAVWKASDASPADGIRCVEAAEAALPGWSATHPKERRRILLKAADIMQERAEDIASIWRTEMGSNFGLTSGFVMPGSIEMLQDAAARATTIQGSVPFTDPEGQSAMVYKVPIGVVLSVVPWNAPPVFGTRAIAPPLAAGCTVVVKASELTPRTYYAVAKCYIDAGVPAGVVNIISCRPEAAAEVTTAMIEHNAVRKIHFTGSTNVGRKIATTAAKNLKPCIMELGGKNSAIVLDDANLETAAAQCILGAFLGSGQICMSTDRIIVDSKVAPQFQAVFSAVLGKMFASGNAPPSLVNAASKERVTQLIAEAKSKGASIVDGGWSTSGASDTHVQGKYENGVFMRPIVVKDVTTDMKIWTDEIFGLAVTILTVDSEQEAIKLANNTEYGLSSSVFTEDLRRGLRIAKAIDAGQVHINRMTIQDEPSMPFGGVKASGWGRFNNKQGLEEFLTTKSVTWMD